MRFNMNLRILVNKGSWVLDKYILNIYHCVVYACMKFIQSVENSVLLIFCFI